MFIKLTNASPQFRDNPVILKKDIIITVFSTEIDIGDTNIDKNIVDVFSKEQVTVLFCGASGTWHVKETVDEVFEML
jgi:hypothetical protein